MAFMSAYPRGMVPTGSHPNPTAFQPGLPAVESVLAVKIDSLTTMVSSLCEQQRKSQQKIEELTNTVTELTGRVEHLQEVHQVTTPASRSKGQTRLPTVLSVS